MSESQKPTKRLRRLQWTATGLCIAAVLVNFFDRSTIGIANLSIRQEFGLNATEMGGLLSAWSLSYAIAQLPSGFLVDRLGARALLGIAMFVWSVAQTMGGLATGAGQLFWSRLVLGVAEAPAFPGSARVVTNWFPLKERGLPTGCYNAATNLSTAIAPPILTALLLAFGWRSMFIAMGAIGIAASILWFILYREVEQSGLTGEERHYISDGQPSARNEVNLRNWLKLTRHRTLWGMILGSFGMGYVFWMFVGWLPAFLEMEHHLSIAKTGIYAALPWIGGVCGALCTGYVSDLLARRGHDLLFSRKLPTVIGLIGLALFTALAAASGSMAVVLVCIFLAVFFGMFTGAGLWILLTAVLPKQFVASAGAMFNCSVYLGATCSPIVTGLIVDVTGSFVMALLVAAGMALAGSAFLQFMVKRPVDTSELEGMPAIAAATGD